MSEKRIKIDDNTARETIRQLRDYAARRRADGADHEAARIEKLADSHRHLADSKLRDCPECEWVGTYLELDDTNEPRVVCPFCGPQPSRAAVGQ